MHVYMYSHVPMHAVVHVLLTVCIYCLSSGGTNESYQSFWYDNYIEWEVYTSGMICAILLSLINIYNLICFLCSIYGVQWPLTFPVLNIITKHTLIQSNSWARLVWLELVTAVLASIRQDSTWYSGLVAWCRTTLAWFINSSAYR